jgi:hypothetical protein
MGVVLTVQIVGMGVQGNLEVSRADYQPEYRTRVNLKCGAWRLGCQANHV